MPRELHKGTATIQAIRFHCLPPSICGRDSAAVENVPRNAERRSEQLTLLTSNFRTRTAGNAKKEGRISSPPLAVSLFGFGRRLAAEVSADPARP
jgi:hypothetical protein